MCLKPMIPNISFSPLNLPLRPVNFFQNIVYLVLFVFYILSGQLGFVLILEASVDENENEHHQKESTVMPCLARGELSGVFLARSFSSKLTRTIIREHVNQLSSTLEKVHGSMLPLLVSSDDEGGHRLNYPAVYSQWPSLMSIGATNNPLIGRQYGLGYGHDLKQVGMNVVFSPVSDVNIEPDNPIIGPRSFGSSLPRVSAMINATVGGFLDAGIAPTLKHWPGHGATKEDSHLHLPSVDATLTDAIHLAPFTDNMLTQKNVNGAPIIMSGHLLAKGLDQNRPVSISKIALTNKLKKELGFLGVIVSDALNMRGITSFLKIEHESRITEKSVVYLAALEAGNDLLLDSSFGAQCGQGA